MTPLQKNIVRGMRAALAQAGVSLVWASGSGDVPFDAIENPVEPAKDGVQPNKGNATACTLDCLAEDFADAAAVPDQQESLAAADLGIRYRIIRREWVRGQPVIRFHCTTSPL